MLNFYRIKSGYIKIEGNERLDLINRLSTNEVNSLGKFKGIKTILTSDKGRFVDLLTLYNFGDFVFCTCSFNNDVNVIGHLDKYTIMDDFRTKNMQGTHESVLFFGENVQEFANEVFKTDISSFSNNDFSVHSEERHDTIISRNDGAFGGFIFIYPSENKEFWNKKLFEQEYPLNEISVEEYDVMRIEAGIPAYGKEMSELTNPLECGLNKYVSFTKGCYIGQEVIARLDAYDKINKHLVGVISEQPVNLTGQIGDVKFSADNKECGFVSSAAISEKYGNIGLGFVKTIFLDYSKDYFVKSGDNFIKSKIVNLPFK
jgi:tRNA-modifying protein YgfZ